MDADLDDVAAGQAGVDQGPHRRPVADRARRVGPDVVVGVEGEQADQRSRRLRAQGVATSTRVVAAEQDGERGGERRRDELVAQVADGDPGQVDPPLACHVDRLAAGPGWRPGPGRTVEPA